MSVLLETNLPNLYSRGKVRDTYDLGDDRLLMVATDRISAFDVVLPNGVPHKGAVLTQLSAFWFEKTAGVLPNHFLRLVSNCDNADLPFACSQEIAGRSMIVRKAQRLDIECVARGYLSGSGWVDYQKTGTVCGIPLPKGLRESEA
ncbi:MAG: phosphoribosylaminoimidazolesuccinocarboxamide synthase, partial [Dehalococcoidia bacterium]